MDTYLAQHYLGGWWSVLQIRSETGEAKFERIMADTRNEQYARDLAESLNSAARTRRLAANLEGQS